MAQQTRVLGEQARGSEFKSPAPRKKLDMALCHLSH